MTIEIKDNFLNNYDFELLQKAFLGGLFPWFYAEITAKTYQPKILHDFQFCHTLVYENETTSDYVPFLNPFIEYLKPSYIKRIKANLTTVNDKIRKGIFHRDYDDPNVYTSIYYINSTNGGTLFEDGTRIECVENRLITFSKQPMHAPELHTNSKIRCVINFNYYL